jgi:hypothetical protein
VHSALGEVTRLVGVHEIRNSEGAVEFADLVALLVQRGVESSVWKALRVLQSGFPHDSMTGSSRGGRSPSRVLEILFRQILRSRSSARSSKHERRVPSASPGVIPSAEGLGSSLMAATCVESESYRYGGSGHRPGPAPRKSRPQTALVPSLPFTEARVGIVRWATRPADDEAGRSWRGCDPWRQLPRASRVTRLT